jgi:hypothetical protein
VRLCKRQHRTAPHRIRSIEHAMGGTVSTDCGVCAVDDDDPLKCSGTQCSVDMTKVFEPSDCDAYACTDAPDCSTVYDNCAAPRITNGVIEFQQRTMFELTGDGSLTSDAQANFQSVQYIDSSGSGLLRAWDPATMPAYTAPANGLAPYLQMDNTATKEQCWDACRTYPDACTVAVHDSSNSVCHMIGPTTRATDDAGTQLTVPAISGMLHDKYSTVGVPIGGHGSGAWEIPLDTLPAMLAHGAAVVDNAAFEASTEGQEAVAVAADKESDEFVASVTHDDTPAAQCVAGAGLSACPSNGPCDYAAGGGVDVKDVSDWTAVCNTAADSAGCTAIKTGDFWSIQACDWNGD